MILCTGEVLWDVFDGREHLGGAPLNFSAMVQRLGHSVTLLTAVGEDARGRRALEKIRSLGLSLDSVQVVPLPTGAAEVATDERGNASFLIERPAAFDRLVTEPELTHRLAAIKPCWIYFGTLAQTEFRNEQLLRDLVQRIPDLKRFYDMNLREGHWNMSLVQRLSGLADLLKVNDIEAQTLHRESGRADPFSLESFCRAWAEEYDIATICVTLGGDGCAIFAHGRLEVYPGFQVKVIDTVGAGDAFAAAFLHGLLQRWPTARGARFANAVGAVIASHAGAIPDWKPSEVERLLSS